MFFCFCWNTNNYVGKLTHTHSSIKSHHSLCRCRVSIFAVSHLFNHFSLLFVLCILISLLFRCCACARFLVNTVKSSNRVTHTISGTPQMEKQIEANARDFDTQNIIHLILYQHPEIDGWIRCRWARVAFRFRNFSIWDFISSIWFVCCFGCRCWISHISIYPKSDKWKCIHSLVRTSQQASM